MNRDASENVTRPCGTNDEVLFDFIDGALPAGRVRLFQQHLEVCDACRSDVRAYRDLEKSLDLLSSLEARPGFDLAVLEAVLGSAGVTAPATMRPLSPLAQWARAYARLRRPAQVLVASGALIALVVSLLVSIEATRAGGWRALGLQAFSRVVVAGVDVVIDGAAQLLAAVKVSDVFLNVARTFEPLLRSVPVAVNAFGAEFWLFSTLLSLLALLGAVKLATGSVERGIGRVHLVL